MVNYVCFRLGHLASRPACQFLAGKRDRPTFTLHTVSVGCTGGLYLLKK